MTEEDEDPVVDLYSSVFTRNPYAFTGAKVNSPVMSIKVKEVAADGIAEEVQVENPETPFRILLRNNEAVPPMNSTTNRSSAAEPQVIAFHCANGTKTTQYLNCSAVNQIVTVDCDSADEYEGNVTCPVR